MFVERICVPTYVSASVCTGPQAILRLLSFILRAMRIFSTKDYCDPICGLKTEMRTVGPSDIFNAKIFGHQP